MSDAVAEVKLDAGRAIYTITRGRFSRHLCVPNYTPAGWWECDVFEATKQGYFREYEVKLTRGDFFSDCTKAKTFTTRGCSFGLRNYEKKHDLLAARSERGPTRFWYVTTVGLVQPGEVPVWAGLIEIVGRRMNGPWWPWREHEVVKAPRLHRGKCADGIAAHARGVCYWRMHKLMARLMK